MKQPLETILQEEEFINAGKPPINDKLFSSTFIKPYDSIKSPDKQTLSTESAIFVSSFGLNPDGAGGHVRLGFNEAQIAADNWYYEFYAKTGNTNQMGFIVSNANSYWGAARGVAICQGRPYSYATGSELGLFMIDYATPGNTRFVYVSNVFQNTYTTYKIKVGVIGGEIKIYVDDVEKTFTTEYTSGAMPQNNGDLIYSEHRIGRWQPSSDKYWSGVIADLKYTNANGVIINCPFQGSCYNISDYTITCGNYSCNLQGRQDRFHYNLNYGFDKYTNNTYPSDPTYDIYVPYKNGAPIVSSITGYTKASSHPASPKYFNGCETKVVVGTNGTKDSTGWQMKTQTTYNKIAHYDNTSKSFSNIDTSTFSANTFYDVYEDSEKLYIHGISNYKWSKSTGIVGLPPIYNWSTASGQHVKTHLKDGNSYYIGGYFTEGVRYYRESDSTWYAAGYYGFAEYNLSTGDIVATKGCLNQMGSCWTICKASDGNLYIGGTFTTVNDVSLTNVARWNGTTWEAIPNLTANSTVIEIKEYDGYLYFAGAFSNYLKRLNLSDGTVTTVSSGTSTGPAQSIFTTTINGEVITFVGGLLKINNISGRFFKYNWTTSTWTMISNDSTLNTNTLNIKDGLIVMSKTDGTFVGYNYLTESFVNNVLNLQVTNAFFNSGMTDTGGIWFAAGTSASNPYITGNGAGYAASAADPDERLITHTSAPIGYCKEISLNDLNKNNGDYLFLNQKRTRSRRSLLWYHDSLTAAQILKIEKFEKQ